MKRGGGFGDEMRRWGWVRCMRGVGGGWGIWRMGLGEGVKGGRGRDGGDR